MRDNLERIDELSNNLICLLDKFFCCASFVYSLRVNLNAFNSLSVNCFLASCSDKPSVFVKVAFQEHIELWNLVF